MRELVDVNQVILGEQQANEDITTLVPCALYRHMYLCPWGQRLGWRESSAGSCLETFPLALELALNGRPTFLMETPKVRGLSWVNAEQN